MPCAASQPVAGRASPAMPVVYNAAVPQLSDEQRRRAEAAVALKFGGGGDGGVALGVGAKLMARMGFGAAEGSKGGLGRDEHVRRALTLLYPPLVPQSQQKPVWRAHGPIFKPDRHHESCIVAKAVVFRLQGSCILCPSMCILSWSELPKQRAEASPFSKVTISCNAESIHAVSANYSVDDWHAAGHRISRDCEGDARLTGPRVRGAAAA